MGDGHRFGGLARPTPRHLIAGVFIAALAVSIADLAATAELPDRMKATKTISYCGALSRPPMEFLDDKQQPVGVDVELGDALASRLGLTSKWINIPFAGLIPALLADHCDAIISQLFIKPQRLEVIDQIPYMNSQEGVLIRAGTPKITTLAELSGKKAAAVVGSTAMQMLEDASADLAKAGKPAINIVRFPENTPALQQLQFGQVYAYGMSYETALYYGRVAAAQFEIASPPYHKILTGIGVSKNQPALRDALTRELSGMKKDGSYAAIFKKWRLEEDMLP